MIENCCGCEWYEDGGAGKCSICVYYKIFSSLECWNKASIKIKEKNNSDEILTQAKQLYESIRNLVIDIHNSEKHIKSKNKPKSGNRKIISGRVEDLLKSFLGKDAEKNYKNNDYKKSIDIFLKDKKIAVEIKTWLEFNSLGAAVLESMVSSHNKFFVFSLSVRKTAKKEAKEEYEKLQNLALKTKLIDGLVVLDPEIPNFETDLINFLTSVKGV